MTKSDLESSTNQNLLEYNPNLISVYYRNCYSNIIEEKIPPVRDSYIQLVCNNVYRNFKLKDSKEIITRVSRSFVSHFNEAVLAVAKAKQQGCIGKYNKLCIKKKNGKNRVVYNPSPEFKQVLVKFLKVLEYVSFDKYNNIYKCNRVHRLDPNLPAITVINQRYKKINSKQVLPHKKSIDGVLASLSGKISKYTKIGGTDKIELHKLDIKNAFQSTSYSIVKGLYESRLLEYHDIRKFIIDNLGMCFVDGKLPPGYPTSSILFNFVKDIMLRKFKDKLFAILNDGTGIDSYVDDIYLLIDSSNPNKDLAVARFKKYIRKWGYRINKNKNKKIEVTSSIKNIISLKFKSTNILGKYPKQGSKFAVYWSGSRRHKNKLRMLEYILKKEQQNSGSSADSQKDSAEILKQKVNSFKDFYFPVVGSHTYRAML